MNVDKFGHHIHKSKRIINNLIPASCALKRLSDNNLDAQNKIIKNIKLPVCGTDSANKEYVDKSIEVIYKNINEKYSTDKELLYKSLENSHNTIQLLDKKLNESIIRLNNFEKHINKPKK